MLSCSVFGPGDGPLLPPTRQAEPTRRAVSSTTRDVEAEEPRSLLRCRAVIHARVASCARHGERAGEVCAGTFRAAIRGRQGHVARATCTGGTPGLSEEHRSAERCQRGAAAPAARPLRGRGHEAAAGVLAVPGHPRGGTHGGESSSAARLRHHAGPAAQGCDPADAWPQKGRQVGEQKP